MKSVPDRHDISDQVFQLLEPLLPGRRSLWGGIAKDNRRFIKWRNKGVWEKILEQLADKPDYEGLMIDASYIKVHPHAAGAVTGKQKMSRTKGGSTPNYIWPWIRMVCRSEPLLGQAQQPMALKLKN